MLNIAEAIATCEGVQDDVKLFRACSCLTLLMCTRLERFMARSSTAQLGGCGLKPQEDDEVDYDIYPGHKRGKKRRRYRDPTRRGVEGRVYIRWWSCFGCWQRRGRSAANHCTKCRNGCRGTPSTLCLPDTNWVWVVRIVERRFRNGTPGRQGV
jgi:hypothetical protein